MKIALDAMGGDFGPPYLVAGAVMALREYAHIEKLFLVGDTKQIESELKKHKCNDPRIAIVHSTQVVDMSDKAWAAVRRTQFNVFVLVDAGANIDARPEHLLQYAIMGSVYSRHVLGYKSPRVGLISLGEEDVKGTEKTKEVFKMLKKTSLNFRGNIEGRHLFEDPVEVVVCDGFVGNVILKTCESIAVAIFKWLKHELTRSPRRKAGAFLAKDAFLAIKDKTNYEYYGGSPLLGVNGICIIAHGASTPLAIKNALRVAAESIEHQLNPHIVEEIRRYHETTTSLEPATAVR